MAVTITKTAILTTPKSKLSLLRRNGFLRASSSDNNRYTEKANGIYDDEDDYQQQPPQHQYDEEVDVVVLGAGLEGCRVPHCAPSMDFPLFVWKPMILPVVSHTPSDGTIRSHPKRYRSALIQDQV
jgi:hypothetical protein